MADATFKQLRTTLDTRLTDTLNKIWDAPTKDGFVLEALGDAYVYVIDRDKTTTTVQGQAEYPIPGGVDDALTIGLDVNSDGSTAYLSQAAWEVINSTIIFSQSYYSRIPAGVTMIVVGPRHLTVNDLIPAAFQEYILQLSLVAAFESLSTKLGSKFLPNDMTMGDLLNKKASHERRVAELRRTLPNRYLVRL